MPEVIVRVNYDDQPNELADKFADALRGLGINVVILQPNTDDVWLDYKITIKNIKNAGDN